MAANEVSVATLLWPFRANWREAVSTGHAYSTTIFTSTSGKEQRRGLRVQPLVELDFLVTARTEGEKQQLDRFLQENLNRAMIVPDYTRVRRAEVTSDDELALDGVATWAQAGGLVVIRSETTTELRRIVALVAGVIITNTPFTATGAVQVYPGLYGKLSLTQSAKVITAGVKEVGVSFEALPGFQIPVYLGAPGEIFDGREVFLERVNWAARSHDWQAERTRLDYGKGRYTDFTPIKFITRTYKASLWARSREEMERIAGFFFRRKGRLKEFFAPTWENDLDVVTANPGATLVVEKTGATNIADNTVDRALMIRREDGTHSFHKVTALVEVGGNLSLTVEPNIPVATAPVRGVSWMPLCRFGSDRLTVSHRTAEVATFELSIQTLEYRAASA